MNRLLKLFLVTALAVLAMPVAAFAADATTSPFSQVTPMGLHLAISAAGLAVAMILLVEALGVRRIALGGAIAEKLHYVILAIVCLGASALAKWTSNFVSGVTFEQTEIVSEALVVLAMGLLAAYFYSVRAAMRAFLTTMTAEQTEQHAHEATAIAGDSEPAEGEPEHVEETEAEPLG